MITLVTCDWCNSQASATWATDTPCACAIGRMASMHVVGPVAVHRREVEGRSAASLFALLLAPILAAEQAAGQRTPYHQADTFAL